MYTYAVIGLGQLGESVARHLSSKGMEVIAIDRNMARVEAIKENVSRAICMDSTNEAALREAGVVECGTVVLALGENQLEEAVLTTMLLRQLGVGRIVSRAASDVQGMVLERLGVSRVVFPERQIGIQIARQLLSPGVVELIPLSEGSALVEVPIPERFWGKTLVEIQLRKDYGLNAVAIKKLIESANDKGDVIRRWEVDSLPGPDSRLEKDEMLVLVGSDDNVARFTEKRS